jgi:nucleoside-diphosphate-sugar epimerase
MGWKPQISLEEGIASTYRWYLENKAAMVKETATLA